MLSDKLNQLKHAKKVLVLAVGGGNDSVSTLLLQTQLHHTFSYAPEMIDIVAVLPDCLDYHHMEKTSYKLIHIITPNSTRSVQGKEMKAFPERILSQHKNDFKHLPIRHIYGISMKEGSIGIEKSLIQLVVQNQYDLVLAIDVGGDFIAVKENIEVLSPMMDGYMLYALKGLQNYYHQKSISIPTLYSVFGLGTDGESTPFMLEQALKSIPGYYEGTYQEHKVLPIIEFYREIVEHNRYSRTTDFTMKEIQQIPHDNPAVFRGRFHVKQKDNNQVHYGTFLHEQNPNYFGKYYLFDSLDLVENPFALACHHGIEWFLQVQKTKTKINHELNGQAYMNIGEIYKDNKLKNISLLFGTPSRKFNEAQQKLIIEQIAQSIVDKIYDMALVYAQYQSSLPQELISSLLITQINKDIILLSKDKEKTNQLLIYLKEEKNSIL